MTKDQIEQEIRQAKRDIWEATVNYRTTIIPGLQRRLAKLEAMAAK